MNPKPFNPARKPKPQNEETLCQEFAAPNSTAPLSGGTCEPDEGVEALRDVEGFRPIMAES